MQRCTLSVRLKPRAKRESVAFTSVDAPLQVAVTAPPVENRANDRCIALLAERLGVPKSRLCIIRGGHSRDKVIACEGVSENEARRRLAGV
ncbi:MAG: DUF167 domain-containing protein [Chitinispirillaceae bacterium]|nr:DUF167 domain-containing protein [Chitinispirillaceae bacterium]